MTQMKSKDVVTQAESDTLIGAVEGGSVSATGTEAVLDLTRYKGKFVDIQPDGQSIYMAFDESPTSTVIDLSTALPAGSPGVPVKIPADVAISRVVPIEQPYLHVLQGSGGCVVRVVRS